MSDREFAEGDVIIQQGGPGDYFYILASGTCDIFKDGARVLQVRDVSADPPPPAALAPQPPQLHPRF